MHAPSLLQAIRQISRRRDAESQYPNWMYVAVMDEVTCETCLDYETQLVFTLEEVEDEFPDLRWINEHEIYPNVHMTLWGRDSQCRCRLFPFTSGTEEEDLPDLPKGPVSEGPVSDKEFDDWVTGLLSAGYITAAVYDLIVARRKKKKEEKK